MTTPAWPNQHCPVYIGSLMPGRRCRLVQIMRPDGVITPPEGCASDEDLARLVARHRPGTDLSDPAGTYWVDHPWQWPQ